jgi:hypothetical protein
MSSVSDLRAAIETVRSTLRVTPRDGAVFVDCARDLTALGTEITAALERECELLAEPSKPNAA